MTAPKKKDGRRLTSRIGTCGQIRTPDGQAWAAEAAYHRARVSQPPRDPVSHLVSLGPGTRSQSAPALPESRNARGDGLRFQRPSRTAQPANQPEAPHRHRRAQRMHAGPQQAKAWKPGGDGAAHAALFCSGRRQAPSNGTWLGEALGRASGQLGGPGAADWTTRAALARSTDRAGARWHSIRRP